MKKSSLFVTLALVLLGTALSLVIYGETQVPPPRFTGTLKGLLPSPPPGWALKEKPIADTPEMQQAVGELLNFSDGVFADYTNAAGDRLSVYIAYWVPGKMSHRLVASHTPDVCWVGGGWKKVDSSRLEPMTPISGPQIPAGESRVFTANDSPEHVWYWHLVGNESKSYGTGTTAPWYAAITDIFKKGLNQREEQFFIRLSSNRPLRLLEDGPVLPNVLRAMPWPNTSS